MLAQIVMSARVLYGLGRFVPALAVFHRANPRLGTPVLATALATAAVITLALTAPLVTLAEITSMVLLCVFIAVNAALIALKRRGPAPAGVFSAPGWLPWAGLGGSLLALGWSVAS